MDSLLLNGWDASLSWRVSSYGRRNAPEKRWPATFAWLENILVETESVCTLCPPVRQRKRTDKVNAQRAGITLVQPMGVIYSLSHKYPHSESYSLTPKKADNILIQATLIPQGKNSFSHVRTLVSFVFE